jgi:hypothetical protein
MEEKLTKLYNTLMLVETKGESTKLMSTCLNYVQGLIDEAKMTAVMLAQKTVKEGE